jgi:hypothetical protein
MRVGPNEELEPFPLLMHLHFFGAQYCTQWVNIGLFWLFLAFLPKFGCST